MSRQADPRLIGAFLVGAVALLIAMILLFGRGHYFSSAKKYVAYFQGSVNGLNVGAPVKLKGVTIGSVTDVLVQYDMEHNRVLTPVITEIDLSKVMDIREQHHPAHPPSLQELIARGLRARLSMFSLVTGQLFVDVNFHPDRPAHLVGSEDLGVPEIPTIPSSKEEIESTIDETLSEFRKLPIREAFEATLRSLHAVDRLLSDPEAQASVGKLNQTLDELRQLIRHVDTRVDGLAENLAGTVTEGHDLVRTLNHRIVPMLATTEHTLASASETLAQAKSTLAAVEALGGQGSELNSALRNFADAARSVRVLADYLERNPQALLLGRRPEPLPR